MTCSRLILVTFIGVVAFASQAKAAIVFQQELLAEFDVSFYSTGPLAAVASGAGFPLDTPLAAKARGLIQFTIDDITPSTTTANILDAESIGRLQGFVPGNFFSISPNVQFVGGRLANIQQTGGVVTSADVVDLSMVWDMQLVTPAGTATIVSAAPLPFSGTVTGLPFSQGDLIVGPFPGTVDGLLQLPGGGFDPTPAIAVSNRTLTAVPEPSSGISMLFGLVACFWRRKTTA